MATITLYRWRVRDPITGRRYVTRYLATAESILLEHPDAELVPGSEEVRDVPDGGLSAEYVQRGPR
jgi:hypothetical protein